MRELVQAYVAQLCGRLGQAELHSSELQASVDALRAAAGTEQGAAHALQLQVQQTRDAALAMELVARQQYEEAQSSQVAARASSAQLLAAEEHAQVLHEAALHHRQQQEVWLQQQQEQQRHSIGVLSGQLRQEQEIVGQLRHALLQLESATG